MAILTLTNLIPNHLTNHHFTINQNVTSKSHIDIGLTLLNKDISPLQGFAIEFILTFILVLCVYSCIDTKRKDLNGSFPLSIGFAVVVGALFGVIFQIYFLML